MTEKHQAGKHSHLYSHRRWRAIRAAQLRKEPLCGMCRAAGRVVLATICDHIEPHRGDMVKFWTGATQSLCKPCHDSHKQSQDKGGRGCVRIGADGWPVR